MKNGQTVGQSDTGMPMQKTDRQTDKETDIQRDRQKEEHTNRETDTQTKGLTDKQAYRQTGLQTNRLTDKQAYRQTGLQTNRQTKSQTDRSISFLNKHKRRITVFNSYSSWPLFIVRKDCDGVLKLSFESSAQLSPPFLPKTVDLYLLPQKVKL
jgi:hypothetical protein